MTITRPTCRFISSTAQPSDWTTEYPLTRITPLPVSLRMTVKAEEKVGNDKVALKKEAQSPAEIEKLAKHNQGTFKEEATAVNAEGKNKGKPLAVLLPCISTFYAAVPPQTNPPSVPLRKYYPDGHFPEGQLLPHPGQQ